jgi:cytochrome P450
MIEYNPLNPRHVDDNASVLAAFRADDPVAEISTGVFLLTRHEDVTAVLSDHRCYRQGGFVPAEEDDPAQSGGVERHVADHRHLGEMDPPEHTPLRRVLAYALRPDALKTLEPVVRRLAAELVAGFPQDRPFDLMSHYAAPLPALAIAEWAGLPDSYRDRIRAYSDDVVLLRAGGDPATLAAAEERVQRFDDEVLELVRDRRATLDDSDDLITQLVRTVAPDGKPYSEMQVMTTVTKDVIMGGVETTTHLLANIILELVADGALYQQIRSDRALVPPTVDETLRHLAPVEVTFRRPITDVTLSGRKVPANSTLVVSLAAANRDDRTFARGDTFDPRCEALKHVGFGHGLHRCVGARLALLEAVAGTNAVLDRCKAMRLVPGFRYERVEWWMMRGPRSLEVEIDTDDGHGTPTDRPDRIDEEHEHKRGGPGCG